MVTIWIYYVYACLYAAFALYQDTVASIPLMLTGLILCLVTYRLQKFHRLIPWLHLLSIILLHAAGHSNLCYPLYVLALARFSFITPDKKKLWTGTFVYAAAYLLVMNIFVQSEARIWLYGLNCLLDFTAIALLCNTASAQFLKKERLHSEPLVITQKDSLTGLYNFEEAHRRLEQLIRNKQSLVFILIDCNDLKAMNTSGGFQAGNFILKQMADLLQILFKDAHFIARYGGDEFAVVMPLDHITLKDASIQLKLDSELPKLTGIQNTYGIATYPSDAQTKDDLILHAEHNLFMKKRDSLLKQEEHMQRSEKLRVVGELASGMAHEIRNPLTTVRGFLQLAKASGYNIETWYNLIMDEVNRMSDLTGEFLQFSKPHRTDFRTDSLHDCILKVISLMESEATSSGHVIHFQDLAADEIFMLMDQDKMTQLLLNIVKNACEAMETNGSIHIQVSRDPKNATLVIADNGPGIPSEYLEQIFHPFFTTKETGTGLGLSICYKIVQDHHGTLEVESELDKGTRFILTFPMADKADTLKDNAAS
ncbi:ATP-binding protein [Paenibacillus ferrarius]|uniref:ATP-binding protein n=1 Tax=Paenibacillus ferrarius TaxID=1469647 RepID=UPI003D2AB565